MASTQRRAADGGPRQLAAIGLGLAIGLAGFVVVALFLPFGTDVPADAAEAPPVAGAADGELPLLALLSGVHVLVAASCWATGLVIGARLVERARRGGDVGALRTSYVLRWALFEAPALFGVVIVVIGGTTGVLPGASHYYANLLSAGVFFALIGRDVAALFAADRR